MGFITAIKFLTIIPIPWQKKESQKSLGESLLYFPLVGLLLGALLSLLYFLLSYILPASIVYVLLIIALVILTGAHHLDGLMDTFDGLVIGKSHRQRLDIMADSKIGAFGIIAAVLLILLKYVSLYSLNSPINLVISSLLIMTTLSRWMMVSAIFLFPTAKSSGLGFSFKQGITWQIFAIATLIALIPTIALFKLQGLIIVIVTWLIMSGMALFLKKTFGGLTGDNYGAINEITEVLVILHIIITPNLINM